MIKVLDRNEVIAVTRPNWSGEVTEDYTFKTNIFRSRNGTETREAMRQSARIALQYVSVLKSAGMQRHMADMAERPERLFFIPVRWRSTFLTAAATVATDVLTIATPPFWIVPGQPIIITDEVNEEAATILSVVGSTVTLEGNLSVGFANGSRVMMAHKGRTAPKVAFQSITDMVWNGNVRFDVDPGWEPQPYPEVILPTFEGRELFLTEPNWRDGISIEFDALFETVDSGRGTIWVSTPELDQSRIEKMGYSNMTAEATDALIAFFLRHKGQRTGFFMPSWQDDVSHIGTVTSGAFTLVAPGVDFAAAYAGSTTYNVLIAFFEDGSYQVNRIANIVVSGSDSQLTVVDGWAQDVTQGTRISFCHHWRFASDTLSVRWITNKVSNVEIAVQTLQSGEND